MAVLYLLVGMALGIRMGLSHDHTLFGAHAHINLVGWASFSIYGLVYRAYPKAAASKLAVWHFWIANIGAPLFVTGVAGISLGHEDQFIPFAAAGAIISILGALTFAIILFRIDGSKE